MSENIATEKYPIFVYGTLRPGARQHSIVRSYVERVTSGFIHGYQMYSFGRFPGAVRRPEARDLRGELLFIKPNEYEACLERLDRYESAGWLFNRVQEFALTEVYGEIAPCWLYVASEVNLSVEERNIIRDNDWFAYNRG